MDIIRFVSALVGAAVVYLTAKTDVPMALAIVAFYVIISSGWTERRLELIAKSLDVNFGMLRHLQRMPDGEPFED